MKFAFYTFNLGDVDDVEIYAAQPIYEWQQTPQGQWVMEHAHDLVWTVNPDVYQWGQRVTVFGKINDPKKVTEYLLRWGNESVSKD